MKQAFSLGCDFKEDGNGMPPSQEVGGADVSLGSKAQGIGLCQDRDHARRGGCLTSGMGLAETAPRPGSGKGQGVTSASWFEDSKLGNSSLCSLRTPQPPLALSSTPG